MTTPDSVLHQRVAGTFIGPVSPRPDQPQPVVVPIDWVAYDVPRLWEMLRHEDDEIAWGQARGFENLAQLLLSHHDSLLRQRHTLAAHWSPDSSPTAGRFFALLDELIRSLADDAVAHACTSRALDAILDALKTTRARLAVMKQQWDQVTTDWTPEWWDEAAADINRNGQAIMRQLDAAVGDHRQQLLVPTLYTQPIAVSAVTAETGQGRQVQTRPAPTQEQAAGSSAPPPPVPGYDPVLRGPQLESLPGAPQRVAAMPGSPVSLLPVPPGNPYAPGGGAYVLPGPGIGRGGFIYPMPPPAGAGARLSGASAAGPGPLTPLPASGGPAGSPSAADGSRTGRRTLVWQIAQGVPPVIGPVPAEQAPAREQVVAAQAAFTDWFAELATPWIASTPGVST